MKPYLVLYATKHGQTRRIAERIAAELRSRGRDAVLADVAGLVEKAATFPSFADHEEAIFVAPLYAGHYPRKLQRLIGRHVHELANMPSSFVSVSLSQATLDDPAKSAQQREEASKGLAQCVADLSRQTRWNPDRVLHVAGALAYTQYGPFIRWVMKRIARRAQASTDTSRDHEFTKWEAIDHWVAEVVIPAGRDRPRSRHEALANYQTAALVNTH